MEEQDSRKHGTPWDIETALDRLIGEDARKAYEAKVIEGWQGSDDYWSVVEERTAKAMKELHVQPSGWTGEPTINVHCGDDIVDSCDFSLAEFFDAKELERLDEAELIKLAEILRGAVKTIEDILDRG
jgi:hypothetical protein